MAQHPCNKADHKGLTLPISRLINGTLALSTEDSVQAAALCQRDSPKPEPRWCDRHLELTVPKHCSIPDESHRGQTRW
ncbi:hypothetical protein M422DRAFT_274580 [Sphaerobolus stellatus SS14]|uniref:Uncharacterized protein n=1 Tax=Sphaerobolus stellatus (strain SS14) TaxID=990650 RepID=A0A0C9TRT8_SPHS4|nr:hypothetical protein M422DRAFT_274580 [Sphaerobolus stellatus SS14]